MHCHKSKLHLAYTLHNILDGDPIGGIRGGKTGPTQASPDFYYVLILCRDFALW